ncbi:TraR/DksA C4-type zinc finger protein [uncultured Tolumonas sp.]|uniref:TraR/DksA C4-type zinc finger protein n=1 Tax=uncultured Tolumonas sp. TaxID=263765 RepID=UPI002A0A37DC|nr:TraR/DksA C4-type zinc finger protein [uncultured Tolumonas sp.]
MSDVVDRANDLVQQRMDDEMARRHRDADKPLVIHRVCVDCEQQIPAARLASIQSAKRCVECQVLFEEQEAIRGGHR